jgi:hypothetical protein
MKGGMHTHYFIITLFIFWAGVEPSPLWRMLSSEALVRTDVPLKHWFLQEPHGITSHKTAFFIATTMKTSNLNKSIITVAISWSIVPALHNGWWWLWSS